MYLLFFLICQSESFNKIGRTNLGAAASCLSCCRRHHRLLVLDINYEHLVIAIYVMVHCDFVRCTGFESKECQPTRGSILPNGGKPRNR